MSGTTLRIDARDVIAALTRAPREVTAGIDTGLGQGALLVARDAQRRVEGKRVGNGLARGITAEREGPLRWVVDSTATEGGRPYAVFVERGVAGGKHQQLPDGGLAAIATWIKARGIVPRLGDRSQLNKKRQLVNAQAELPWLIGRLIARRGIKAFPYMAPALESQRGAVLERVRSGVAEGLRQAGLQVSA